VAAVLTAAIFLARVLWKPWKQVRGRVRDMRETLASMDSVLLDASMLAMAINDTVAICQFGPDGRCLKSSRAFELMSGCNEEDMLGYGWKSLTLQGDRFRDRMAEAFRDRSMFRDSFKMVKTGADVVVTVQPSLTRSGRVVGFSAKFDRVQS
jgi:PAS domain S-box-containing protein